MRPSRISVLGLLCLVLLLFISQNAIASENHESATAGPSNLDQQLTSIGNTNEQEPSAENLVLSFRTYSAEFDHIVRQVLGNPGADTFQLRQLSEDLEEFRSLVHLYREQVLDQEEYALLVRNIIHMQHDVQQRHDVVLQASHHGRPLLVETVTTNQRGRPCTEINPGFLDFAYRHRSTSGISRFLHVGRRTVRRRLLQLGIAQPGQNPFPSDEVDTMLDGDSEGSGSKDDLLDPQQRVPDDTASSSAPNARSYLSSLSDNELDELIISLGIHYRRAVPGPNALWHHDGQHGLIRWGIVIHGYIDGYSRLVTGLRASNNNYADTVLHLFLQAAAVYGVPSRLRGDHGTENLRVAAWMEYHNGQRRGSYIWGQSVHNVRIERLWVDVTAQVGQSWHDFFTDLEMHHGLDINNDNHRWLLHYLFLPIINQELSFWAESWNNHRIQIRDGPNRSPIDMFGFDMFMHGFRGHDLNLNQAELEVYGVDWEALRSEGILRSQADNNPSQLHETGDSAFIEQTHLPTNLNFVHVEAPQGIMTPEQLYHLEASVSPWRGGGRLEDLQAQWLTALVCARSLCVNFF
ncbi:hypothetical protein D9758_018551 [Tetrapyrgos nigripes]|uniref:Integrase catalytic domain-containing protein n=1 Tax=Tetrapyrgos nigripes TaxID=182062 RepID=A0A8H5BYQ5_9AGAR|nr:hypothetical protein D9758_018551 [Tetrapyrgos nigripes]